MQFPLMSAKIHSGRHMLTIAATLVMVSIGTMNGAVTAKAATLGLPVQAAPEVTAQGSFVNMPALFGFDFLADGGASTAPAVAGNLDVRITGDLIENGSTLSLNVGSEDTGLFLGGVLSGLGFTASGDGPDSYEFLFSSLSGSAAGSFGSRALAVLEGEFGTTQEDLFAGTGLPANASVKINPVGVIPAPASLPLLVSGLFFVIAVRSYRSIGLPLRMVRSQP